MKIEESLNTAEEILDEAEKTSNLEMRQRVLAKATKAFVKAGRLDLARRTLDKIENPYWRSTTLKTILSKLHESGEVEESKRIVESTLELSKEIKDVFLYIKTLVNISEAFASIDCRKRGSEIAAKALNTIEGTKDPSKLLAILPNVVKALAETGNINKAREKAEQIEDDLHRSIAFKYIVRALASNEKVSEAMKFVDQTMMLSLIVSTVAAGISGYLAIDFLLKYLKKNSTFLFVYYRIALGVFILILLINNFI